MTVHGASGGASVLVARCLSDCQYTSYTHGRDTGALSLSQYGDSDAPSRTSKEGTNRRRGCATGAMVRGTWCVGAIRRDGRWELRVGPSDLLFPEEL